MKIESVDFFYLSMPEVTTEADGSQDALLVRVAAGGFVGYGECEAAPLPSIAAFVAYSSMDVLQAAHPFSGIEMALWDIRGKARGEPVWKVLGYAAPHP